MRKAILLVTALSTFCSCNLFKSKQHNLTFDVGRLDSNVYYNDYLGIKLIIDTPWVVINQEELNRQMNTRKEMLGEKNAPSYVETGAISLLLSLTIDSTAKMPQVLLSSIDLKKIPKLKNETDFLHDYIRQLQQKYENYEMQLSSSDISQEVIAEHKFYTSVITIRSSNYLVYQKEYSIKIEDRLLNIMTNYDSDNYSTLCKNLLSSLQLNP